ncbi:MAG TPA: hypothetical protein PKX72_02590, partial [Chitinophagales bacterium]|nr:hypothetical protein [Chitinophagales bacterium]
REFRALHHCGAPFTACGLNLSVGAYQNDIFGGGFVARQGFRDSLISRLVGRHENGIHRSVAACAVLAQRRAIEDEAAAIRKALSDYTATIEKWDKKRKENEILQRTIAVGSPNKNGIYEGSIIWQYFALGKKKFSDLKF